MEATVLDTNVFVHAVCPASPLFELAARLVDVALREKHRYCIAPQIIVEFAAVASQRRFVEPPISSDVLREVAVLLYRSRTLKKVYPSRGTVARAVMEGTRLGLSGPIWYDLFLAVTMREAGVRFIVTENVRDFRRFPWVVAQPIRLAVS